MTISQDFQENQGGSHKRCMESSGTEDDANNNVTKPVAKKRNLVEQADGSSVSQAMDMEPGQGFFV